MHKHSDVDKFNIAYGITKTFFFGCGVSLLPVFLKQPREGVSFHVLPISLTSEDQQRFGGISKTVNATQIVV